jgi:hypothetical protein
MWLKTQAGHSVNTDFLRRLEVQPTQQPEPQGSPDHALVAQTQNDGTEYLVRGTFEDCQRVHTTILDAINGGGADPGDLGVLLQQIQVRAR